MIAKKFLFAALATVSLAACAGGMNVESASSDSVTIRNSPDRAGDAATQANSECDKFGKKARLRSTHSESANNNLTIFDCIPK